MEMSQSSAFQRSNVEKTVARHRGDAICEGLGAFMLTGVAAKSLFLHKDVLGAVITTAAAGFLARESMLSSRAADAASSEASGTPRA